MKYNVRLIQKKRGKDQTKEHPIYVRYYYDRSISPLLIPTQQAVLIKDWNAEKETVKGRGERYEFIRREIGRVKRDVEKIVEEALLRRENPTPDYVRDAIENGGAENQFLPPDFLDQLDKFIESKTREVVGDVIKDYNSLKKHLTQFQKYRRRKITFEQMDLGFYKDFLNFLKYETKKPDGTKGLMTNSAGKQIKNLKAFLNDRMSMNIISIISLKGWTTEQEEVDSVYLNEDEIQAIEDLELEPGSKLDKVRDLFLIGCETGLRFNDYRQLKRAYFSDDFLRVVPRKTRKKLTIPISPRLRRVLSKYPGEVPQMKSTENHVFNKVIKEVARLAGLEEIQVIVHHKGNQRTEEEVPKYKMVSSHTGRRSFCTNQFLKGTPTLLIRRISGHKTEKAFLRYIRISEEAAARTILKYWRMHEG